MKRGTLFKQSQRRKPCKQLQKNLVGNTSFVLKQNRSDVMNLSFKNHREAFFFWKCHRCLACTYGNFKIARNLKIYHIFEHLRTSVKKMQCLSNAAPLTSLTIPVKCSGRLGTALTVPTGFRPFTSRTLFVMLVKANILLWMLKHYVAAFHQILLKPK